MELTVRTFPGEKMLCFYILISLCITIGFYLSKEMNLVLIKYVSYQKAMSSMYGNTPREAVVDSQVVKVRWAFIPSSLIHILSQVKMYRVTAQDLLPHVL